MNLFHTELVRFWSRRMTWATLAVTGLIMIIAVTIGFFNTSAEAPSADGPGFDSRCVTQEFAAFKSGNGGWSEFDDMSDTEFLQFLQTEVCRNWNDGDDRFWAVSILGPESNDWSENRRESWAEGQTEIDANGNQVRTAREPLGGILPPVAILFVLVSVLLGASYMGADYRSGTVENLLLWEPRRTRVLLTKYLAGFVSAFIATAGMLAFLAGLLLLLASVRGTYEGVDGRFWIDLVSVIGRAGIVGGLFFIMAMGIATISKHTTAAVALIIGWFAISNVLIQLVLKRFRPYELFVNATAFIGEAETPKLVEGRFYEIWAYSHGYLTAGVFVAVWCLTIATIAWVIFRKRDLT